MTRVDVVPVEWLSNKHLLSNHREIKRIPNLILKGRYNLNSIPTHYTMGKGHVAFFYDKLKWLLDRYISLYNECLRRGFNVICYFDVFYKACLLHPELTNNYNATSKDIMVNIERLTFKYFSQKHNWI